MLSHLETQRALLREVRPQTGKLALIRRIDLLHTVHGEVHVGMEHSLETVH